MTRASKILVSKPNCSANIICAKRGWIRTDNIPWFFSGIREILSVLLINVMCGFDAPYIPGTLRILSQDAQRTENVQGSNPLQTFHHHGEIPTHVHGHVLLWITDRREIRGGNWGNREGGEGRGKWRVNNNEIGCLNN